MNKRGQLTDYAVFIVMLFVCALVFLVVWYVLGTLNTAWNSNPLIPTAAKTVNNEVFGDFGRTFDNMFLLMYVGTLIGGLIISYVLQSNPGMFFVLLIVVFFMSIIAGYLGNAYTDVSNISALSGAAQSFSTMGFIMEHYLLMTFVSITLMTIVFFAKPNNGGLA